MRHLKPLIVVFCALLLPGQASAAIDFISSPPVQIQQPVKAMTPSFDGQTLFVLGQNSILYIFDAKGNKQGETKVDPAMDMIALSGFSKANIPEFIFLSSSTTGAIQKIKYEKVIKFDVGNSPFIGNSDAKVTMVIFSDFQ